MQQLIVAFRSCKYICVAYTHVMQCIGKQIPAEITRHSGREIRILRLINVTLGDNELRLYT